MTETITSINNPLIKKIHSLQKKKYRDEYGLFLAEGVRLVEEAARSNWEIDVCLYTETAAQTPRVQAILDRLMAAKHKLIKVADAVLAKICETEQPQGIAAVLKKRLLTLSTLPAANKKTLIAVLDEVQDPGNVGTVIRTADAAGCTAVILTKGCADIYAGKTVRASMGSLFHLPVIENITAHELAEYMAQKKIKLLAAAIDAASLYHQTDLGAPTAIIFGNEGRGVSPELLRLAKERIYIPIYGQAESLNVAVAAAIVLYEAVRQRSCVLEDDML